MNQPSGRSDARANHERVIQAARALFSERGFGVEMREIAERAGVGVGTLYRNFATKELLVRAIIDELVQEAVAILDAALAEPDPAAGLRTFLDSCWRLADAHGEIVQALRAAVPGENADPELAEPIQTRLHQLFDRGIASGTVRAGLDPELLAAYLNSLVTVYLDMRGLRPPGDIGPLCTQLFLRGAGA